MTDLYRALPKVDVLLADPRLAALPRTLCVDAAREELDGLRSAIGRGEIDEVPDVAASVAERVGELLSESMRSVINATGVVIHTNLGRAPWPAPAVAAAVRASGYTNVEMDLASGQRGTRGDGVKRLLRLLTGCEDGLVVNNCAAAVLLTLTALAREKEVVVSRGELVEIGGSFRVPDVISEGGAKLVAVGSTNRTHLRDYAYAIGPETAVLLKVHPSNFKVVGFTKAPTREELVQLAEDKGLLAVEDLGSGSLEGRPGEPAVRDVISAGVHVVTFSGDKLLGGPQAGLIVGRRDAIQKLRRHPLYRALRVGKVTLAAVEATLAAHARGDTTPVASMLDADLHHLHARAQRLQTRLSDAGVASKVEEDVGFTGGGALPGKTLPTWTVTLDPPSLDAVAKRLRTGTPAVVPRIAREQLVLDLRTVTDEQVADLAERVASAIRVG
ncbi:MAG: L-seryl-tRNA(Sec) selenium transferase [Proteobacteria bacterium]|nr:L-seryl-tRNA(Sec) selenium transferase [Pseudomonadota bacterium]